MSLMLLALGAFAALFLVGTLITFWKSPNRNPLADLASKGVPTDATVVALEPDGDAPNVTVQYQVAGQDYRRSVPWPSSTDLPAIGASVRIRYLPGEPGLSRLM